MSITTEKKKAAKKRVPKKAASTKAATKKAASKKGVAKKAVAKKAASKKGVAKKPATKKEAAKKAASKKSVNKRAGTKKAQTKKSTARKSSVPDRVGARNLTARAAEVRAERRQRRRSVVIVLAVITVTGAALIGLLRSPLADIDRIAIEGHADVPAEEIAQAASVPIGTPLVDLDEKLISARVEALPGIQTALVSRRWNGVIRIAVTEREPTLALRTADGFVLVDNGGRQVRTAETLPDGFLPVIGLQASGVPGDPAPPGSTSVLRLMEAMTPPVRQAVSEVIVTGTEMALSLNDGGRAVLGDDRQISEKVVSLETLLLSVDLRCVHEIDLTVPSAPALSRIGEKGNPRDGLADLTKCS